MGYPPVTFVDEDDNVLGAAPLPEVREKGQIHRIARIMVEDGEANILLQKRSPNVKWPNCWDNSAAGHVDEGEDYDQAAHREMFEEIGLKADLTELGKYYSENQINKWVLKRFNVAYKTVVHKDVQTKLQPEEVTEVKWFSLQEVKDLIKKHPEKTTDGLREVIKRYYS